MKKQSITIIAAFLFLIASAACQAEIIKIGFTGEVYYVGDTSNLLEGKINAGDLITGYYTYDSETTDSNPLIDMGLYKYTTTPYGISVTTGGLTFNTNPSNVNFEIGLTNNYLGESVDDYTVTSYSNVPLSNGGSVNDIHWQLTDYTGTALSSETLLLTPPELSNWQLNDLSVLGSASSSPYEKETFIIRGHIETVYLVPEPTTLLLLGLGCLFISRRKSAKGRWGKSLFLRQVL